MSSRREDPPSNLRSLEARINNVARDRGRPLRRVQRAIANTVVGQTPGVPSDHIQTTKWRPLMVTGGH